MKDRFLDEEALIGLRRVEGLELSPDATWLALTVSRLDAHDASRYVHDLWRVDLDGGEAVELTRGDHQDTSPAFAHDGALLFSSNRPTGAKDDEGHDRRRQIWRFAPHGGDPICLTDEPLGVSSFQAARGADVLAMLAPVIPGVEHDEQRKLARQRRKHGPSARHYRQLPVRRWDHWLPEAAPHLIVYRDGERRDLTPHADREHREADFALSEDGAQVALTFSRFNPEDHLYDTGILLLDTATGARRELVLEPHDSYYALRFHPDGESLVALRRRRSRERHGGVDLVRISLDDGAVEHIELSEDIWPTPECFSPDGEILYCSADHRAATPIFAIALATGEVTRVTSAEAGGTHRTLRHTGANLVGIRSSLLQPPAPFSVAPEADATPELLADLSGFELPDGAITIEDLRVTSSDGEPCQYYVVKPADLDAEAPALIWIHGGPISHWSDVWHWRWNSLVAAARGYVTILPNPRGSTGFGQQWVEGIWGNVWGEQCYEDLMAVADAVAAREDVDASRMVAMGGSFGGYMTNWIGGQTDRFCCLLTHAGLANLSSFHDVTDFPAWWRLMFGVDPYDSRDTFDMYSPLRHVADWKSPTLIIHGQQDYRVPVGEALALFAALQHHEVPSELLIFPDENHWILKPRNIVAWYEHVFSFIAAHCSADEA